MENATPPVYQDGDKVHLFLSYFGIFSLIPFFIFKPQRSDPQKEFVYWHACQGLGWLIVAVVFEIASVVLSVVLGMVGLGFVSTILSLVVFVVVIGLTILAWIKAFGGQKWEMPVASKIAGMIRG
jgi:uncharacterized membrane protein